MATASQCIASFAANFVSQPLAEAQRRLAYRAFLDTFSVAVAGRNEEASRIAHHYLRDAVGTGKASVWGSGEFMPAESAALFNGISGHVLDYDDVMQPMRGHPSVVLLSGLAALAQVTGADGKRFSSAYIAGFEVVAKISKVMAIRHASKGWHPTASLGVLGAVVACSVILGLNEKQICHAIGLAVAQAAGNRQNFGTMAKAFQVGQAGAAAVRAALLAQAGYDAPLDALDGKYGYMALYAQKEDLTAALKSLGSAPLDIDAVGLDVKKYPCCYAIHRTLDGVLAMRADHGLTLDKVDNVEIITNACGLEPLTYADPHTELEAKFSMEYPVAAALLDGNVRLVSFTDESVNRPAIREFLPRIKKQEAAGEVLPRWAEIKMRLKNGTVLEQRVTSSRGDAQNPLTDDDLIAKTEDCFSYGGVEWPARVFAESVLNMSESRVDDVLRRLPLSKITAGHAHAPK
jgi:2-methylcitrate dehydratase PrpD